MARTTADYLCERLIEWGVNTVYAFPGDGINGILGAMRRHQDRLRFVQTRHEEMAAFMACGHAKFTGDVGVCMATSGPGAIHLLNGLYDAKLDHQPVVAIVGQTYVRAMGGEFQQEVNLLQLYSDVASAFCQQVNTPSAMRHCIDRAFRIAKAEHTVTCIIVPADVQEQDAVPEQPHATHTVHTGIGYWAPRMIPEHADLQRAADLLNSGAKVAMLVGQGALHATDEVVAVADTLGAGVAKALLGKAAVPDDVPFCTGSIGLLGTRPSWEMMRGADTLLMVGSSFPYSEFLPQTGQARGVQIDLFGRMLSIRYPMEIALVGDSKQTLHELLPMLNRKKDRSWQEKIVKNVEEWWRLMADRGTLSDHGNRIRPQGLFQALSEQLPDNAILSSDSGSAANWYARHIKIRRGMKASLSGNLATMVPGVPYAIAAKFAFPDRVAIAMVGDGAMQMGGMAEMLTAAKYYRTWTDPRLVILVLNNEDLNQVTWEQRVMEGDPKFEASQDIPYLSYADYAGLIGLNGIKVEKASQVADAWRQALAADRPTIIDAMTDPEEPPLPPHITFQQAESFAKSIFADPAGGIPGAME
ncbi:MAG: thiamine pyrophosphate-requiring protein, partial [Candidatus Dormibacteraceae bacterium]